jgi:DNA-binding NarL/FixJ family response regulator
MATVRPTDTDGAKARMLSRREIEVVELVSRGFTNAGVAERLAVSVAAIKFHLASVYRKLGVSNRTEAVVAYLSEESTRAVSTTAGDEC